MDKNRLTNAHVHLKRTPGQKAEIWTQHRKSYGVIFANEFDVLYGRGIFLRGWSENDAEKKGHYRAYFEIFDGQLPSDAKDAAMAFIRAYFHVEGDGCWRVGQSLSVFSITFKID